MPVEAAAAQTGMSDPTAALEPAADQPAAEAARHPFLLQLGERVRELRARRGLTRKSIALAAGVSERHLANLEYGTGNASILILLKVAQALQCPLVELLGDVSAASPERLLIRELLAQRSEPELRRARLQLSQLFGSDGAAHAHAPSARHTHIALVGLRGAGKSTLGHMLADDLDWPFVELSQQIEQFAGCRIGEIHNLYGANAYRRYERRALEEAIELHPEAVIATPGGLVSDAATFNLLLTRCFTIWLQAKPEHHLARVQAQGDTRPMAGSREVMDDLRRILIGRSAFYAKADLAIDTSAQALPQTFELLREQTRAAIGLSN